MELRVEVGDVSLGGARLTEIAGALQEPAAQCESALESAADAAHDPSIASVISEVCGLTRQAHGRLGALLSGLGSRASEAGSAYAAVDGDVARAAGTD